jgi:hypothetical protein
LVDKAADGERIMPAGMLPQPTPGKRKLISGVDALAVAQLSSFKRPILPKTIAPRRSID